MKKFTFYSLLLVNIIILLAFFVPNAFSGEIVDTDTIYWDWYGPTPEDSGLASADPIANDLVFNLYMSEQSGDYDIGNPDAVITYAESAGDPLDYEFNLTIPGNGGETKTLYFVLTAFYDGGESGTSNEVSKQVTIPRDAPLNLRFTITVEN